jgi:hypothetical protein
MIRDSLDESANNYIVRHTRDYKTSSQWRPKDVDTAPDDSDSYNNYNVGSTPVYMRLTKSGDTITGWARADPGDPWIEMQSRDIPLTEPFYIGFGITSHNENEWASARFTITSIK